MSIVQETVQYGKPIKIATLNLKGLGSETQHILKLMEAEIDILCVHETKVGPNTIRI